MIETLLLEQLGLRIGLLRLRIVKKPKIKENGMPAAGEIYQIRCREQPIAIMCTHAILDHSPKKTPRLEEAPSPLLRTFKTETGARSGIPYKDCNRDTPSEGY
jgi:hypothetical protein